MRAHSASRAVFALLPTVVVLALLAAGCGPDNALVGGACASGYTQCGLRCVRIESDSDDCGACGKVCPETTVCTAGACRSAVDASMGLPAEGDAATSDPNDSRFDSPASAEATDAPFDGSVSSDDAPKDAPSGERGTQVDGATDAISDEVAAADADDGNGEGTGSVDAPHDEVEASYPDSPHTDATVSGGEEAGIDDSSLPDDAADSNAADIVGGDESPSDANAAGSPCDADLAFCSGQCIDVTGDPINCGSCNVVCASQLCQNSHCVGAASGGVVYIGHDFTTTLAGTAQARVLSNAVFVSSSNPLHVMSYERYASASAIARVDNVLRTVAGQLGRTLSIRSTANDDDVVTQLALPAYDVLLIHDQPAAPDGALAALGAAWAGTLSTFALGGGVIVILDGGAGIGQMPALATGTGLLGVTAHSPIATGTRLLVSSQTDVVGIGVISPYGAGENSVAMTTEPNIGNVVYVVELPGDAGALPVVVHKAF